MTYADNNMKIVVALLTAEPPGPLMNALGHLTLALGAEYHHMIDILDYPSKDATHFARVSRWPVIVLGAKKNAELRALHQNARDAEVYAVCFTRSMIGAAAAEQQANTKALAMDEHDYIGVALVGPRDKIDPLTKRLSLFRNLAATRV